MTRWLLVVCALAAATWGLMKACGPKPAEVQVHRVGKGLVERLVTNSRAGIIKARRCSQMGPQVGGLLSLVRREGDSVKQDEVLFVLDSSRQGHTLDRQKAALELSRSRLAEATANAALARRSA